MTKTRADEYGDGRPQVNVPEGAMAFTQVVIFDDDSIHVAAPPLCGYGEEQIVAALKLGLETMGYDVMLERNPDGVAGDVEITGIDHPAAFWAAPAIG